MCRQANDRCEYLKENLDKEANGSVGRNQLLVEIRIQASLFTFVFEEFQL